MADFSFSDDLELKKLNANVLEDPDDYEHWEKLVRAAEQQEGGINRNSSPSAITATREVYDRFLARFPLFYGYWKKYADLEFNIAGTEAAEMVYERGVASNFTSVDLWVSYCTFKTDTNHDVEVLRELFERAVEAVGLDYMSHPLWDRYIEYEERVDNHERIFKILERLIHIPMHQYARYFQRYVNMGRTRPIHELAPHDVVQGLLGQSGGAQAKSEAEVDHLVRPGLEAYHQGIFSRTQGETNKRWPFEQKISRPYFHVTELDQEQLDNWAKYLDFEEGEGDYVRIKFLYERCLATAANYPQYWFRYVRWMSAQKNKQDEIRNIYQRASCIYVSIAQPQIRLDWAYFEEAVGQVSIAVEIHDAILAYLPYDITTITSLVNLYNRQFGIESAVSLLQRYVDSAETDSNIRGALVSEWANMVSQDADNAEEARALWQKYEDQCAGSYSFWGPWFNFEMRLPTSRSMRAERHRAIEGVYYKIRQNPRLDATDVAEITARYLSYLKRRGDKEAMKEMVQLDRDTYGPASVRSSARPGTIFHPAGQGIYNAGLKSTGKSIPDHTVPTALTKG